MTEKNSQIPVFEIKVKNKFDEDKRNIVVHHLKGPDQKKETYKIGYIESPKQTPQEIQFSLAFEDSLVIEMGEGFGEFLNDVHIELPFVADFELFWEVGEKRVDRPINRLVRDTTPGKYYRLDDARSIIVIPRDQGAWKLKIKSPRNMKEHFRPKKLLDRYLEMSNGDPDDATVGDNGPGRD